MPARWITSGLVSVGLLIGLSLPMTGDTAPPTQPTVSIDESLYALYHDRADLVVSITNPPEGATLKVSLIGKGSEVDTKTYQGPFARKLYVSFNMNGRKNGCYIVEARLLQDTVILAAATSSPLPYNPEAKIGFDKNGFMLVSGKQFFPVGIYTLQDKAEKDHDAILKEGREAGFNTTVFYAYTLDKVKPLLDAAKRQGIKAFIYPTAPPSISKGKTSRTQIVEDIQARMNHPALLGWYIVDEPEGIGKGSVGAVRELYRITKQTDREHPCSIVVMSPKAAADYRACTDIMWIDPYPVPSQPVTLVSNRAAGAVKAVEPDKPVWVVPQAFDWNIWKTGKVDKVHRPTPQEERCMTYLALVHGAKGIIFWAHTASRYYIRDYPDHWAAVKKIAGELRDLSPALLTPTLANGVLVAPEGATIDTMVKRLNGETYVFAVNREPKESTASFALPRLAGSSGVEVLFERRAFRATGGSWQDQFKPLEVHVYKVKG